MVLIVLAKNCSTIAGKVTANGSRDDILPAPQSPPLLGNPAMKSYSPLRSAAWAVAGATLLGGGMLLGFASALVRRRELGEPEKAAAGGAGALDAVYLKRIDELASAVAGIQERLDRAAPYAAPESTSEKIQAVSLRVEQLERRVDQLMSEMPSVPPVDHVLAAVEHMVAAKIGGLDERLTNQVQSIELLRKASSQTDALLQKLIAAVEDLSHAAEQPGRPTPQPEGAERQPPEPPENYPIA